MTINCKLYLATVAGVLVFVGVGQWLVNPDYAPAAIACATMSIVTCLAHWIFAEKVSQMVLQAVLLWIPILIFGALWIWGHSLPNNEGQQQVAGSFIIYTCVPWCCTSSILLLSGRRSKSVDDELELQ